MEPDQKRVAMSVPSTVYQDLIDWSRAKLDYEMANGHPEVLGPVERKVLLNLHELVKPPSREPEIGSTNWVSLLHRYRDTRPDPLGVPFKEECVEPPNKQPIRWTCFVALAEHKQGKVPFPGRAGGLVLPPGGGPLTPPSFARKKDAKQYAARCAVEWLRAWGHMPNDGTDAVKFASPIAAAAALAAANGATASTAAPPPKATEKPLMVAAAEKPANVPTMDLDTLMLDDATPSSASMSVLASVSTSASASRPETPAGATRKNRMDAPQQTWQQQQQQQQQQRQHVNPFDKDAPSSVARVAQLCSVLGLPLPIYKVMSSSPTPSNANSNNNNNNANSSSSSNDNFWSGHAEFTGLYRDRFPDGLGHVAAVYGGRAFARESIAEAVLRELDRVQKARLADLAAVMEEAAAVAAESGGKRGRGGQDEEASTALVTVGDDPVRRTAAVEKYGGAA